MNINNPIFNGGNHQFGDQINNYNYPSLQSDLIALINKNDLSAEKVEQVSQYLSSIDSTNINIVDWWDILHTIKNLTHSVVTEELNEQLDKFFFENKKVKHFDHSIANNAFLSFANEDVKMAESLYTNLLKTNLNIWFSRVHLNTSDSIIGVVNKAIQKSKYGIVLISKNTFSDDKHFPILELKALINKQIYQDLELILVYHNITHPEVLTHFPLLADNFAVELKHGFNHVLDKISVKLNT